jgi:formate dehydrogenase maturation protein FdhE
MELMKERFLLKGDRDACWEQWREIDERVGHRRHDLTSSNYDVMRQRISEVSNVAVYGDPHEAMNQIRSLQQAIKTTDLTKEQRSLLRESLQQWWDRAVARLAERRQRQMAEKIERLESLRDKNEQIVRALEDQISDLEGKISSSWNEDWASRARGWVHEKYEKIADIRRTNTELDAKIRDIRDRVRE